MTGLPVPWPVRAAAVPVGVLYVLHRGPNAADVVLAALSGVLLLAGGRGPFTVLAGQAVLLVAAHEAGQVSGAGVKVWAALALAELAVRRPPPVQLAGAVLLGGAYVALEFGGLPDGSVPLPYRLLLLVVLPVLAGGYLRALRRRALEAERNAGLRAEAARRAERDRIARDLHDIVAHHVSAIVVRVGTARHVPDLEPAETALVLADVHATADTALRDLHELLHVLREPDAAAAAPEPLADLLDRAARAGLRVDSAIDPAVTLVEGVRSRVLHRTVQEAVTNAVKHSGAGATVSVRAGVDAAGAVAIAVRNDPRGPARAGSGGFGLAGMRERIEAIGGTLDCGPDGSGWSVRATLPAAGR